MDCDDARAGEPRALTLMDLVALVAGFAAAFALLARGM